MATATKGPSPYRVQVDSANTGVWGVKQTEDAAAKVTNLLQEDLDRHHPFFNMKGFHNHIVHHLLSLYGTGAPAAAIQAGYDRNASYQRLAMPLHDSPIDGGDLFVAEDLARGRWAPFLGRRNEAYYPDFLRFFQREMEDKGYERVLLERVFARTPAADDLLDRLFEGFLHPLIQLMYGLEFAQPAIVAEGLAQAAVHGTTLPGFFLEAERRAEARREEKGDAPMPSMLALYEAVAADPTLGKAVLNAARDGDPETGVNPVLDRAMEELLDLATQVHVRPDELDERTAEMFDGAIYVTACGARQHPEKYPKVDFFLMHHCNVGPIFLTINAQPWIPIEAKVRLLEWKMRIDLLQYAARACPPLGVDMLASYQPRDPSAKTPSEIIACLYDLDDDGHAIKLARSAVICQELSRKYENKDWVKLKDDELWSKVQHLFVDSVMSPGKIWVRQTGLPEAWDDIPDVDLPRL